MCSKYPNLCEHRGYLSLIGPNCWYGEVPIGGGCVFYSFEKHDLATSYRGEVVLYWASEDRTPTRYLFNENGITTCRGVQQIEARASSLLEDLIRLDGGNESDRGYSVFCELAGFLPEPAG